MSVYVAVCLSVGLSLCLSACLSLRVSVYPCLSVWVSVCLSVARVDQLDGCYWCKYVSVLTGVISTSLVAYSRHVTIWYDTIRDAILTCTQKLTFVSLIYHTELQLPRLLLLLLLHPFNGLFSWTTWVGPFQKGKTSLVLAYPGCPGKETVKRVCLQCRRLSWLMSAFERTLK